MTTYKEINGTNIEVLASDPSNPVIGQIWYNTTSQSLKGFAVLPAAWSTGGNLPVGAEQLGGAGTQTAGLSIGGYAAPGFLNTSSEYNGSAWTAGGTMTNTRFANSGTGLQTAALAIAGYSPTDAVEEYNGSAWTAGGALNTEGTSTEEYNGTAWTAGGALPISKRYMAACGTQTAGLGVGGKPETVPTGTTSTEEYNGSAWTAGGTLNTSRKYAAGCGTQTAGFVFGGSDASSATGVTESYNGTSWTTSPSSLNVARQRLASATNGTQTSALAFGGLDLDNVKSNSTEEFSEGGPATVTISGS